MHTFMYSIIPTISRNIENQLGQIASRLQFGAGSIVLPLPSKDMDFKNFWRNLLRKAKQEAALDLHLMNAYQAIENNQAKEALLFLEQVDLSHSAPCSQAIYCSLEGQARMLLKEYDKAVSSFRQAIKSFEIGLPITALQIMWVRNWIGIALYEQGKITQALEELHLCLKGICNKPIDDNQLRVKILLNMGYGYLFSGQNDLALYYYGQALSHIQIKDEGKPEDLARLYWGSGLAYCVKKNLPEARLYLGKSLDLILETGNLTMAARVRSMLGLVMLEREEFKEAEQNLKEAFVTADTLSDMNKDYIALASASTNLALLYKLQERWVEAQEWGTVGLSYAEKLTDPLILSQAHAELAEIHLGLGREEEAIKLFNSAIADFEQSKKVKGSWQIYYRYGLALRRMGQLHEAFDILSKGYIFT